MNNNMISKQILNRLNEGRAGSIFVRGETIWVDFRYMNQRVRESTGLKATHQNAALARKQLDKIHYEIDDGTFKFVDGPIVTIHVQLPNDMLY